MAICREDIMGQRGMEDGDEGVEQGEKQETEEKDRQKQRKKQRKKRCLVINCKKKNECRNRRME